MMKIAKLAACLILSCMCLSAADVDRKIVMRVEPEYPEIARKMQIRGLVKLKVWIRADGSVSRVEYIGGHPLLAESAVTAVKKWKFELGRDETSMMVEIRFAQQ
jgi:protein TonB